MYGRTKVRFGQPRVHTRFVGLFGTRSDPSSTPRPDTHWSTVDAQVGVDRDLVSTTDGSRVFSKRYPRTRTSDDQCTQTTTLQDVFDPFYHPEERRPSWSGTPPPSPDSSRPRGRHSGTRPTDRRGTDGGNRNRFVLVLPGGRTEDLCGSPL